MRTLAVDVGNSRIKTACFGAGGEVLWSHPFEGNLESPADIQRLVADAWDRGAEAFVLATVRGEIAGLAEAVRAQGFPPSRIYLSGADLPVATTVRHPESLGVDRVAAALGAHAQTLDGVIVVDCGTAITVDFMDREQVFQGGAIVPGRRLAARAMHQGTARLPEVSDWGDPPPLHLPGKSTEEAMVHGLDCGIPAMIDGLVQDLRRVAGPHAELWVTGGDASWYRRRSALPWRSDPLLVLRGLWVAASREEARHA